jgi:hypothetical protein
MRKMTVAGETQCRGLVNCRKFLAVRQSLLRTAAAVDEPHGCGWTAKRGG